MKNITTIITVIGLMYNVNSYAQNIISPCGKTQSLDALETPYFEPKKKAIATN